MQNTTKGRTATVHGLTAAELTQLAKDARKAEREAKAMKLKAARVEVVETYENLTRSISAIARMIKTDEKLKAVMQAYLDELGQQKGATIPLRSVTKGMLLATFAAMDEQAAKRRAQREQDGEKFKTPVRFILTDSKGEKRRVFNFSQVFRALNFRVSELIEAAK